MNILQQYFHNQLQFQGLKRGDLPRLLGLVNPSKCLRRFDAFVLGNLYDNDILQRIRASHELSGDAFEKAYRNEIKQQQINVREQEKIDELKARNTFVPHLWMLHEQSVPSPIFVVGFLGVNRFKYCPLPDTITIINNVHDKLIAVDQYYKQLIEEDPDASYFWGPFGRAHGFLFRDSFDHVYEYSFAKQCFISERSFDWKCLPRASLTLNGRNI